jgi:hypothetical protein
VPSRYLTSSLCFAFVHDSHSIYNITSTANNMDKISLEVVHHLADLQYEHDTDTGQRWPVMLGAEKQHILNFRATCKAFRDASWIPFGHILTERIFYLNEDDLAVLGEIAGHHRLGSLITTLTFASQVFTSHGLSILDRSLDSHPSHADRSLQGSPAWQRSLSSRCDFSYEQLIQFRELYSQAYRHQEDFWSTGHATVVLSDCLYRLSQHQLRAVRICPRPCHVSYKATGYGKTDGKLSFTSRTRTNHSLPHGAVNNARCDGWRNIDRVLTALGSLDTRYGYFSRLLNRIGASIRIICLF